MQDVIVIHASESRLHPQGLQPYISYLQAGPVIRVHLPHLYPGVHKGYAFCQYKSMVGHLRLQIRLLLRACHHPLISLHLQMQFF